MKKFLYGVLNLFLFILTGLFIFKLLSPLYDGLIIKGDCLSFMWWGESTFLETFTKNEHTCFILAMFNCICGRYLPELFKIHPQVWYSGYYRLILFLAMYLLQFSFLANFSKYFKNKKFNILWLFLIFPSFLFLMINGWADWIITDDCWSFAYIFMPVFSIVFLSECEKIYVQNQVEIFEPKKNYYQKIVLFLLFICVASSYEFQRFVTCGALFFGYFLHYFFVNKNLNHKKSILIYLFVIIINLLMFFVPSAQNYIGRLKLPDIVAIFPKYMSLYFKNFIVGNSELFLAIILLVLCAIFFAPKTDEKKRLFVFETSILASALIFPILLIFFSLYNNMLMVEHSGIILMTKIYLFYVSLAICGWLIANIKINSIKFLTVICCFAPILSLFNLKNMDMYVVDTNKQFQKRMYILERVFLLYGREHKIFLNCNDFSAFVPKYSLVYFIYLYDKNAGFEDYQQVDFCSSDENSEDCNKKLIKFLKEKTGYELTDKEIEKQDFQKYYGY